LLFVVAAASSLEIVRWKLLQFIAIPNGPLYLCHKLLKISAIRYGSSAEKCNMTDGDNSVHVVCR